MVYMNEKWNLILSPEELLGPPKIDVMGFILMILLSLMVGLFVWIGVFIFSYILLGNFTLQSGLSPILMSMITFFVLTWANYLYTAGLSIVLPHMYSRSRTLFVQVSVFSIVLYVIMVLVYLVVWSTESYLWYMLVVYILHILVNTFWLLVLTGMLSVYRYVLLYIYGGLLALILSGLVAFVFYGAFSLSSQALFIFMLFGAVTFVMSTICVFWSLMLYSFFYKFSGSDPIGSVFGDIAREETQFEKQVEKTLFNQ